MFGQKEEICGYENLSVEVSLSPKRLFPHISLSYSKKAPAFAKVDNLHEKLEKHWGKYYDSQETFQQILAEEEKLGPPPGVKLQDFSLNGSNYTMYKVGLEDESFHEQSFYLQCALPFFIDGASQIDPSPFWKYYIIYSKAEESKEGSKRGDIVAYATVFEAHQTAVKFRAKVSQVLVLPTY